MFHICNAMILFSFEKTIVLILFWISLYLSVLLQEFFNFNNTLFPKATMLIELHVCNAMASFRFVEKNYSYSAVLELFLIYSSKKNFNNSINVPNNKKYSSNVSFSHCNGFIQVSRSKLPTFLFFCLFILFPKGKISKTFFLTIECP